MNKKEFVNSYDFSEKRLKYAFIDLLDEVGNYSDEGDSISEIADNIVDIFHRDLKIWALENYEYIEYAVKEYGLNEKDFDYHRMIQVAQYYKFYEELSNAYDTYKREVENGN